MPLYNLHPGGGLWIVLQFFIILLILLYLSCSVLLFLPSLMFLLSLLTSFHSLAPLFFCFLSCLLFSPGPNAKYSQTLSNLLKCNLQFSLTFNGPRNMMTKRSCAPPACDLHIFIFVHFIKNWRQCSTCILIKNIHGKYPDCPWFERVTYNILTYGRQPYAVNHGSEYCL